MARTAITAMTMITTSSAAAAIHQPTGDLRCWAVWKSAYALGWPFPYAFCPYRRSCPVGLWLDEPGRPPDWVSPWTRP